jgi:hypothetical protein
VRGLGYRLEPSGAPDGEDPAEAGSAAG